jgi:hypothetical protein
VLVPMVTVGGVPVSVVDVIDMVTVLDGKVPASLSVLVRVIEVPGVTGCIRFRCAVRTFSDEDNLVPAQFESGVLLDSRSGVRRDTIPHLDDPPARVTSNVLVVDAAHLVARSAVAEV